MVVIASVVRQATDMGASQAKRLEAFGEIVRRYQDMAVGYAFVRLGAFQLAEDAAQEAFLEAWKSLDGLQQPDAFVAWFRQIVSRSCARITRKRQVLTVPAEDAWEVASGDPNPHESAEAGDLHRRVMEAIKSLPEHEQLVTALYYIDGYTQPEIADFLEVPTGTVKSRLHKARTRLQRGLMDMVRENMRSNAPSRDDAFVTRISARLAQPEEMQTEHYVNDVIPVDGNDAWELFCAAFDGDEEEVRRLLAKDPNLVHAQYWYQYPLHNAVRGNNPNVVRILLEGGAEPGRSRFMYKEWRVLVPMARERGYAEVAALLEATLTRRYGYSPDFETLADAIRSRDRSAVEAVVAERPTLAKASDVRGNNAIHWAVMTRQLWLIDMMAELGADIDAERADGKTPILLALHGDYWYRTHRELTPSSIRDGSIVTGYLLAKGAEYKLSVACAVGDEERVAQILRDDPDAANRLNSTRASELGYAAGSGHLNIVNLLLSHGADPNQPEDLATHGRSLFEASAGNHLDVARALLDAGADPNVGMDSSGSCLSISEARHGAKDEHHDMQKLLRKFGAVTHTYEMSSEQVLEQFRTDAAQAARNTDLASKLWDCGDFDLFKEMVEAYPERVDQLGSGVLRSSHSETREAIRLLVHHGFDPNGTDWLGKAHLHTAATGGNLDVADALLGCGADIDAIEYEEGGTALAWAARKGKTEMVAFLLEKGADVNAAQGAWATPLRWTEAPNADYPRYAPDLPDNSEEVSALLRQHGASRE
ncbi:sigma-70 family RNA polymerase sigma factor [Candidatus Poribacteria bacterium]|nr:sigma-70 family RNA polymerase sigma factor [Candidatus Poribacteria bacterium]